MGNIEFVDLGLSVKWANTNLGAEHEYDYGDYYMWGSTTPNNDDKCSWATCPFNNGSSSYYADYFASVEDTVCPDGILASDYDAVYQATNGKAHIPTQEQIQELIDGTDNEWVEDYNGTGINGYKFVNKTDSSKFIFIPASGYRSSSYFSGQGSLGYVWSSSLRTNTPYFAWYLYFNSDYTKINYGFYRYFGYTLRGVSE